MSLSLSLSLSRTHSALIAKLTQLSKKLEVQQQKQAEAKEALAALKKAQKVCLHIRLWGGGVVK